MRPDSLLKTLLGFGSSAVLALTLVGCGGGSSTAPTSAPVVTPNAQSAPVGVSIGDAPSDSVIAFEATISALTLNTSSGSSVSVLSGPAKIELSHLAGTTEFVGSVNVPAGTYTSAVVTISGAELTAILAGSPTPVHQHFGAQSPVTVTFASPLTVSTTAGAVALDFDLSKSLTVSGTTFTFTPTITSVAAAAVGGENEQDDDHGRADDLKGTVVSVTSNSFVLKQDTGNSVTIAIDSTTSFNDITGLSALKPGFIVEVDAVTASDGTLHATRIESETETETAGMEAEGLIRSISGTSLVIAVDQSAAHDDASRPTTGNDLSVDITKAKFRVQAKKFNLSQLGFSFGAITDLAVGQRIEVDTETESTSAVSSNRIQLQQQALSGTVSGCSGSLCTFTLTLPADSAFAVLTGQSTVTVNQVSDTQLKGIASFKDGDKVRVRGWVFHSSTGYNMAAARITN
ncbi:MAG TPA: DUF5666 domain-containing protein [Terriglobales bacterium]